MKSHVRLGVCAAERATVHQQRMKAELSTRHLLKQQVTERVCIFHGSRRTTIKDAGGGVDAADLSRCDAGNTLISCFGP